ncbi:hypothetical protein EON83_08345 [bacterium]|nr:MAG: hypothetical protein EON83_08345 [bacterium]
MEPVSLDLATWEVMREAQQGAQCRDADSNAEWVWGVGQGMYLPLLVGRRLNRDTNFNLCVADEHQPYRVKYLVGHNLKPHALEWKLAVEQKRIGHIFYVDESLNFLTPSQQAAWQIFLRADGIGSWHRIAEFPSDDNSSDIVQNQPQSFRWHSDDPEAWQEKAALEWFASFQVLAKEEKSDVAFAARWAAKERNERDVLSASTQRGTLEIFLRLLRLAVLSDEQIWRTTQVASCQLQLVEDEATGQRLWVSTFDGNDAKTARFERIAEAAITHFEPFRGGELADTYLCVRQWLNERRYNLFHYWIHEPTQHEKMEALLELHTILHQQGLSGQNLLV